MMAFTKNAYQWFQVAEIALRLSFMIRAHRAAERSDSDERTEPRSDRSGAIFYR